MIKTPLSARLECLELAVIRHDLFISGQGMELHLWDTDKLTETLKVLESREVTINTVVRTGKEDYEFYIINF